MPRVFHSLDELRPLVGVEVAVGDWFQVTQQLIDAFAATTGDRQWIHVDPARAAASPLGGTIAHGFLTLSLLSRFHFDAIQIDAGFARTINYGLDRVRFPAPVRAGAFVRGRHLLEKMEEKDDHAQLHWRVTVEVRDQAKPALVADWLLRLYRE